MKLHLTKMLLSTLMLICIAIPPSLAQPSDARTSAFFSLDACAANLPAMQHMDYTEFTAQIDNTGDCANMSIIGGYLYRNNPEVNTHSCTPGHNGAPAMCVGSVPGCNFIPDAEQAIRIDISVTPGSDGIGILSGLKFYEQGPVEFNWINGISGPNNYPTLYGVRVVKNGVEIFLQVDIPTELAWNLNTFDFSGIPAFTVTSPTVFNIELLSYCPIGNGATVSAWDIDDLTLSADCCLLLEGGTLDGGPFEFCVGNGIPDHVSGVTLSGAIGAHSQYVVTDESGTILGLPPSPEAVNFDEAGPGTCLIWHLSYFGALSGLQLGNNLLDDLSGDCFELSNSITVIRNDAPEGGELTGGPFEFCVGNGIPDHVSGVELTGNTGDHSQYVVTDTFYTILGLPPTPEDVDFDIAGSGTCLIWHLSYDDDLSGLEPGNNLLTDIEGCFGLSNSITVVRNDAPEGGELTGGPFEFCVGDGIPDHVSGVELSGNTGEHSQYVVTDTSYTILGLPPAPDSVNFDIAGSGTCLIWHISYDEDLSGLELGNNLLNDVEGCFGLSNAVTVIRNESPEGGELTGGPFEFCVGDGIPDHVSGIELTGNTGANSQYVVTDTAYVILGLPPAPDSVNFDEAGTGICLIWHLSYEDGLTGLELGQNLLSDLEGCFGLSNSIEVVRNHPEGGELSGGPFEFCVGDGIPDHVSGIELTGNTGSNSQYVVTDTAYVILGLPPAPDSVNFDVAGAGTCLIWHLSYEDGLSGLELGNNLNEDLSGCFGLSNSIEVIRNHPEAGELSGGPFTFCVGNGIPDYVSGVELTGNTGPNSQYVVTDTAYTILGLPPAPDSVNFDEAAAGICLIWHISYADGLVGLEIDNHLLLDLVGCFSLSNTVTVNRNASPEGGELTGGPFEFCVGDGIPDHVSGIELTGNTGANSQYVVTDTAYVILGLPPAPDSVNFDVAGSGTCLIWHISFEDTLSGLELGQNLFTDVGGCFGLSNSIMVIRNQPEGGELTGGPFEFCVGNGIPDHVSGVELTGNAGGNSQYVVTDTAYVILGLPPSPEAVDFDEAGSGTCLIWHLSYEDGLTGLNIDNNLMSDLEGCFSLSNAITVIRNESPNGGELTGGPFEFCVGDGIPDHVSGIELTGNTGEHSQYVVTDTAYVILGLPPAPDSVDFDLAGSGICLIWHISYDDTLSGLELGNNLFSEIEGCFGLSNSITVIRNHPEGGELSGGPFEFCVGDSIPDHVSGIELTGNVGGNSQYVVTDTAYLILGLPSVPDSVDFDGAGSGTCLIWHLSYEDGLTGLELDNNLMTDLEGCFGLSNSIMVIRNQLPEGGVLTGGPFEFCIDSIPDYVSGVELTGNTGSGSIYIITDTLYNILGLPILPDSVDFNEAGPGVCLIWHLSYEGLLSGAEVGNNALTDLVGCFSFSNSITVVRMEEPCEGPNPVVHPVFELKVSPNPASDQVKLEFKHAGEGMLVVRIFDVYGRLYRTEQYDPKANRSIDISDLAHGQYYISVQGSRGRATKSVVLLR